MPRKLKKFCRITKYLENIDKDLHQTFDDLCLFSVFSNRGGNGVTFLYPDSSTYRKKIMDAAYSGEPELAVSMIKALVLRDYLPKTSDFKGKAIANALGYKLEVDKADEKSVSLKGGLTLKLDTGFAPLRSDDRVAVYKLSGSGMLPTSGAKVETQPKQRGGNLGGAPSILNKVAEYVAEQYKTGRHDIYKYILACVYKQALDNTELLDYVYKNMCATERASFYNILQPYSNKLSGISEDFQKKLEEFAKECTTNYKNDEKLLSKWRENRNAVIKAYRSKHTNTSELDIVEYKKKYDEQVSIFQVSNPLDYAARAKKSYGDDSNRLAKDLLTMYCYLSAIIESEGDDTYYYTCYIWNMKNSYNTRDKINSMHNEVASHLTLFGNLAKSDVFKYIPTCSDEIPQKENDTRYSIEGQYLPEPTSVRELFSVEKNPTKDKHGGFDIESMV